MNLTLRTLLETIIIIITIAIGAVFNGGNVIYITYITAFLILIPSALALTILSNTKENINNSIHFFAKKLFKKQKKDLNDTIRLLTNYSIIARRDGVLSLECVAKDLLKNEKIDTEYLRIGLTMLINGEEKEDLEKQFKIMIDRDEEYYQDISKFWIIVGKNCSRIGIIGFIVGLIFSLQNINNQHELLLGVIGAFCILLIGKCASYLFFEPCANKIQEKSKEIIKKHKIIITGINGISNSDNPRLLEQRLFGFLSPLTPKISIFDN